MIHEYTYFFVGPEPLELGRKTRDWYIISRRSDQLGTIRWYGPWRQYCFFPRADTAWSSSCLRDVLDAIKRIKEGK